MSKKSEKYAIQIHERALSEGLNYAKTHGHTIEEQVAYGRGFKTGCITGYEQAEKDLAKAILAEYKKQWDLCPDADKDDDYTISETQQLGRFMMMEDLYEKFCEPVGVTLDDLEEE